MKKKYKLLKTIISAILIVTMLFGLQPLTDGSVKSTVAASAVELPESPGVELPESQGLNTSLQNIISANPMSGIRTESPPTANLMGTANFSYPITVPEGINGLTPDISINYSSDNQMGNCGIGWNLSTSSIKRKTSVHGIPTVPTYDENDISNVTFELNGLELVNIGKDTNGIDQFRLKNEGSFSLFKFENKGFKEYKTDGTVLYYGSNPGSKKSFLPKIIPNTNSGITVSYGGLYQHDFQWYLDKIEDKFGNIISFDYFNDFGELYINQIKYAFLKDNDGKIDLAKNQYSVMFYWKDRSDIRISKLSGFEERFGKILDTVKIMHQQSNSMIKLYSPIYKQGAYGKTLLESIYENEGEGNKVTTTNQVSFNYGEMPSNLAADQVTYDEMKGHKDLVNIGNSTYVLLTYKDHLMSGYKITDRKAAYFIWDNETVNDITNIASTCGDASRPDQICRDLLGIGDYDGDGLNDYLVERKHKRWSFEDSDYEVVEFPTTLLYYLSNGPGKDCSERTLPTTIYKSGIDKAPEGADLDGDGIKELTFTEKADIDGDGFKEDQTDKYIDVNNDGLDDLITYSMIVPVATDAFGNKIIPEYGYLLPKYGFSLPGLPPAGTSMPIFGYNVYVQFNMGNGVFDSNNPSYLLGSTDNYNNCGAQEKITKLEEPPSSLHSKKPIDLNGDGFVDTIHSGDGTLTFNNLNDVNVLKNITNNVTGVKIDLSYDKGPLGSNRGRVLKSTTVSNEFKTIKTDYEYQNGIYDRREREFRGFGLVRSNIEDPTVGVTQIKETTYKVDSVIDGNNDSINPYYDQYIKGQIVSSVEKIKRMSDGKEFPIGKSMQYIYQVDKVFGINASGTKADIRYVYPKETKCTFYDDNGNVLLQSKIEDNKFSYDINGLISKKESNTYFNAYNPDDDSELNTTNYISQVEDEKWINLPVDSSVVAPKSGSICSEQYYYDDLPASKIGKGILTSKSVKDDIEKKTSTCAYKYDIYGNTKSITGPDGLTTLTDVLYLDSGSPNECRKVKKTLPGTENLFETTIYDIKGRIHKFYDIHNDSKTYAYDLKGRISSVTENVYGKDNISQSFTYGDEDTYYWNVYSTARNGDVYTSCNGNRVQNFKYFMIRSKYLIGENQYLHMESITDSMGNILENKKESVVNDEKCWVISGKQDKDNFGRILKESKPTISKSLSKSGYIDYTPCQIKNYEYFNDGRSTKITDPSNYETSIDLSNIKVDIPNTQGILRSIVCSVKKTNDSLGKSMIEYKDLCGQVVKTVERKNGIDCKTVYDYSLNGLCRAKDPGNSVTEFLKNTSGKVLWKKTPQAGKTEYIYNDRNLIATVNEYGSDTTLPPDRVRNISYDECNRIKNITFPGNSADNITYEYYTNSNLPSNYCKGELKSINKGNYYNVEYIYDRLSVIENENIDKKLYSTKYTYDLQGRIRELTYPGDDNEVVKYYYNETGDLCKIDGNQPYLKHIKYNEYGQRTEVVYGNDNVVKYSYDSKTSQLNNMILYDKYESGLLGVSGSSSELLNSTIDYYSDHKIKSVTNNSQGAMQSEQTYQYSDNGSISNSGGKYYDGDNIYKYNQDFEFDDSGNIVSKTSLDGMTMKYYYLNNNTLTMILPSYTSDYTGEDKLRCYSFTYDKYGNMKTKTGYYLKSPQQNTVFTYDSSNHPVHIDLPGNNKLDLKYNSGGQRIKKIYTTASNDTDVTTFVNGFYTEHNNIKNKHISDGSRIIATKVNNIKEQTLFYTGDTSGSTSVLTNMDGNIAAQYSYKPYGEVFREVAKKDSSGNSVADEINNKFIGQVFDKESGLYFLNARYYDPQLGLFTSLDPKMAGLNYYSYCNGDPVNKNDSTGLEPDISNYINIEYNNVPEDYFTKNQEEQDTNTDTAKSDSNVENNTEDKTAKASIPAPPVVCVPPQITLCNIMGFTLNIDTSKYSGEDFKDTMKYEDQNKLSKLLGWGYLPGTKFSSLCYADSLMISHDLNVKTDIDYETKEKFLNKAKSEGWITNNGYVKLGALEFTQKYAEFTGTKAPTGTIDISNAKCTGIGVGYTELKGGGTHFIVYNYNTKNVQYNPWQESKWSWDFKYKPIVLLKY